MNNPFIEIDSRLSNIESLLIDIKHKSDVEQKEINHSVDEVAKILKVSKQSVYSYIRKGKIKANEKITHSMHLGSRRFEQCLAVGSPIRCLMVG